MKKPIASDTPPITQAIEQRLAAEPDAHIVEVGDFGAGAAFVATAERTTFHKAAHSGYRMTEATARELYPSMIDRNILAMIPGEEDAACPGCGARLCWGQKVGDLAKAYCVRSSDANLGIADCNWRGDIRFSFDGKTAWAIVKEPATVLK